MASDQNDDELWERVKQTVKPLQKKKFALRPNTKVNSSDNAEKPKMRSEVRTVRPYSEEPRVTIHLAPPKAAMDPALSRKIRKGRIRFEGRIDLHGMTQNQAHARLAGFVQSSFVQGKRTLLVITGKGPGGEGVLKGAVPRWLLEPEMRKLVGSFETAHQSHGGSGALYLRLKKNPDFRR